MRKLDRLVWAAGMVFTAYGVRVGVRVSDAAALARVAERLPPGWKPSTSPAVSKLYSLVTGGGEVKGRVRRFRLLYSGARLAGRTLDEEAIYGMLESDLQLYVAERAPRRVFVHAGVVGWKGRAILLPGRSLSGKTTLVAELVRAGAEYYSDEYAVLDAEGRVHPYARPLAVREGEGLAQTRRAVEEFGGRAGKKALPVGLVVVSRYERGGLWRPRRLSPGEGVLEMLANTVSARRAPARALAALSEVAARTVILAGARGEASQAAASILSRLGDAESSVRS
jgi:serine kinase of HPr protein (carbohydrate metabolism regulator)